MIRVCTALQQEACQAQCQKEDWLQPANVCPCLLTLILVPSLLKHHCLVPIHQHPVLQMCPHCPSQHQALQVCTFPHHVSHTISVCDARDVLLNDGPSIQLPSGVMGSGANDLHTTIMSAVVGPGTLGTQQSMKARSMAGDGHEALHKKLFICFSHVTEVTENNEMDAHKPAKE